jgi:hypothetical protein
MAQAETSKPMVAAAKDLNQFFFDAFCTEFPHREKIDGKPLFVLLHPS